MKKLEVFKTPLFSDKRGIFMPLELEEGWLQSNISSSKKWTFRGLHHQIGDTAQMKKIIVLRGSIIDFAVDLHRENFGQAFQFKMSSGDAVIIPAGFAHGFIALEDDTIVHYLVDNHYSPSTEISFNWKSVELVKNTIEVILGLNNLTEDSLCIAEKDSKAIYLSTDNYE